MPLIEDEYEKEDPAAPAAPPAADALAEYDHP